MRAPILEDLYAIGQPSAPAVSPDGTQVAYVLTTADAAADRDRHEIWVVHDESGARHKVGTGTSDTGPVWSAAGELAFLRDADDGCSVMLVRPGESEPRLLATVRRGAHDLVWNADGGWLALVAPVGEATNSDAPVVADRLDYKADGHGLLGARRDHIHVIEVATGTVRQVTSGPWNASYPAWSPVHPSRLLFTAGLDDDADLTGAAQVHAIDTATTGEPEPLTALSGSVGPASWTPDGTAIIVVGHQQPGAHNLGLLRVDLGSGQVHELTAGLDRMVMPGAPAYPGGRPAFATDGSLLFCARDTGQTGLYVIEDLDRPQPRRMPMPDGSVVAGLSVATGASRAALIVASPDTIAEVATVDLPDGRTRLLTDLLRSALPDVRWARPGTREFVLRDGSRVQGVLVRPEGQEGPGPLLLDVHGGPHNSWSSALDPVHLYHQVLVSEGWTVLLLNPRGSDGQDDTFLRAAVGNWGFADEADFLEPLDQLIDEGVARPDQLAVVGYSYGGFAVCHLTGRTARFAAAVAGGVVSDFRSFAGTSDMGHRFAVDEFGGLWPDREAEPASPIDLVNRVSTPTLVLQGAADDRCPVGQAEQWFSALRARGVPSQLVVYPGASHAFILNGRPSHRLDYNQRICAWLRTHGTPAPERRGTGGRRPEQQWQQRLSMLADRYGVPGATFGVLELRGDGEQVRTFAHGVLSTTSGVRVTPEARFQIGSITKVWTATLAMALAEDGVLDLDEPVRSHLPELDLASDDHTARVSMRHLLSHTSGLDGDVFTDTGRGDDCLDRYVREVLPTVKPIGPIGLFAYCNSGFSLAGRVIEVVTGMTWDEVLRRRLIDPLGLRHTGSLPEDALFGRVAIGHLGGRSEQRPATQWQLPRSGGPAGAIWASAADVLAFTKAHLEPGGDGPAILSADSARAMRETVAEVPVPNFGADSWGIGWMSKDWGGRRVFGHDGGTIGQTAFLRIVPEAGVAAVLLTNGGDGYGLYRELFGEVFAELADVHLPAGPEPAEAEPVDGEAGSAFTGRYVRDLQTTEVLATADGLRLRVELKEQFAQLLGIPVSQEFALRPAAEPGRFLHAVPGTDLWSPVGFSDCDGVRYLHHGLRAAPQA